MGCSHHSGRDPHRDREAMEVSRRDFNDFDDFRRDFHDDRHDFRHDFRHEDRFERRHEFEEFEPFPFRRDHMRREFRRFPREDVFFIGFPPRRH